jgi:hypothetical protein
MTKWLVVIKKSLTTVPTTLGISCHFRNSFLKYLPLERINTLVPFLETQDDHLRAADQQLHVSIYLTPLWHTLTDSGTLENETLQLRDYIDWKAVHNLR